MAQTDRIGRAGEHFVAAELNRRGAYASPFSGNVPGIDIVATDLLQEKVVFVQVKTKRNLGQRSRVSLRHAWDIPNPAPVCLCLGTCEETHCAEARIKSRTHPHHRDATSLFDLNEVKGKEQHFWVFVSLEELRYWIVPDSTVRDEMIRKPHINYLQLRGGHRPGPEHGSLDATIYEDSLDSWRGCWSALDLGLEDSIQ